MTKPDNEKEIIEQLKQISSKLDALKDTEETKNFQLDMLKVQVTQNNVIMLLSVVISISISFFIAYLTVSLTVDIPKEVLEILLMVIGLQILVLIGIICFIWVILNHLLLNKIDKLRPKKANKEAKAEKTEVKEKEGKEIGKPDTKRLLDWLFGRELTWVAIVAACFIGLVELLPEIRYYGLSATGLGLTFLLVFIAFVLVGATLFSFDRYIRLLESERILEKQLPQNMRKGLWGTMGPFHKILFKIDKNGDFLSVKKWVVYVISSIFAFAWILIIFFKLGLS